jgi:thiol-disulfide isomerase/thioredoxin
MKELSYWDKYLESKTLIVLQAGAEWHGPCKFLNPVLQKIKGELG